MATKDSGVRSITKPAFFINVFHHTQLSGLQLDWYINLDYLAPVTGGSILPLTHPKCNPPPQSVKMAEGGVQSFKMKPLSSDAVYPPFPVPASFPFPPETWFLVGLNPPYPEHTAPAQCLGPVPNRSRRGRRRGDRDPCCSWSDGPADQTPSFPPRTLTFAGPAVLMHNAVR